MPRLAPLWASTLMAMPLAAESAGVDSLPIGEPIHAHAASSRLRGGTTVRQVGAPRLRNVRLLTPSTVRPYDRVEFSVDLSADYDNPFDPDQIALDAIVRTPSGKRLSVPGFLYRSFVRSSGKATLPIAYSSTEAVASGKAALTRTYSDAEILTPAGPPTWRIRFAPSESGKYSVVVKLRSRSGQASAKPIVFLSTGRGRASRTRDSGFVRVSRGDPRFFAFDDGAPYFPLGANACWAGEKGTRDFDRWFADFGKNGANWSRLWLSPNWTTFALENSKVGIGRFDLANAWRLDYVLDLAAKHGLYLSLCVDSYNVLRDRISWPEWERSPQNKANGGPLAKPADFWTNPAMDRLYLAKLRYLVARYGWSTNVMAWEFWNEADGTADYDPAPVRAWHRKMAGALRGMDPYRHLISTSFGMFGADRQDASYFSLPEIDFSQTHIYNAADLAESTAAADSRLQSLKKPEIVAEIGADTTGPKAEEDPTGMQIHDPMWASIAIAGSGGTMSWWWDSYIAPRNLSGLFTAARRFVDGVAWDREAFRRTTPALSYAKPPAELPVRDAVLEGGPTSFSEGETNRPHTVRLDDEGVHGRATGILHGLWNHKNLHNPITFQTELSRPTKLSIEVSGVSGYGGATLKVVQDGATVLDREFKDPDGDRITEDLKQYEGDYAVDIPAGKHTLIVENTGPDWILTGYRFKDALVRTSPPLTAWASVGNTTAIAWIRLDERTWRRVCAQKAVLPPSPPSVLALPLSTGRWHAEIWDTWSGRVLRSFDVTADGSAQIPLPSIEKDLAVKLRRTDPGSIVRNPK